MHKKVVVIGGGIVGLCTAYFLRKDGHEVVVVDQSDGSSGASFVNAGYISPSHIIPLAAPGVMKQGLKWMFNSSSPLYLKPRLDWDFIKWGLAFNKCCTTSNVKRSISPIKDITIWSQQLYHQINKEEGLDAHIEDNGLLVLCKSETMLEKESEIARLAKKEGLDVTPLTPHEAQGLQPSLAEDLKGALYYKCDSHSTPGQFMNAMKLHLMASGVSIHYNVQVNSYQLKNTSITGLQTTMGLIEADTYVLASGTWTARILKALGVNILMQAGKGYRINLNYDTGVKIPAILAESKIAVTPMNGFTRLAGTMEFSGINHTLRKERIAALAEGFKKYYVNQNITQADLSNAACGLRPVTPDGLPYIGKVSRLNNVYVAAGHAMMGWSMAPATGLIIADLIGKRASQMDLAPFNPDRKF